MTTFLWVGIALIIIAALAFSHWALYIYGYRKGFGGCFDIFDEKIDAIPYGHTRKVVRKWYDSELFKTVRQNGNHR